MLVDSKSTTNILYLSSFNRMRPSQEYLRPVTTPLYGFTGDSLMLQGKISMLVSVEEHLGVSTVITNFLVVDCPSAHNAVIGRPTMKVLKAITLMYHLTMKFPTTEGTGYVRGSQYDSRKCYNQLVRMATNRRRLPYTMMVDPRSLSKGPVKTHLDLRIQDEKWTVDPIEELVEVVVNDEEPTRAMKIGRGLKRGGLMNWYDFCEPI